MIIRIHVPTEPVFLIRQDSFGVTSRINYTCTAIRLNEFINNKND